ncbi:MAG: hypothetical protein AAF266_16205 [Planctomycetota bacterium]
MLDRGAQHEASHANPQHVVDNGTDREPRRLEVDRLRTEDRVGHDHVAIDPRVEGIATGQHGDQDRQKEHERHDERAGSDLGKPTHGGAPSTAGQVMAEHEEQPADAERCDVHHAEQVGVGEPIPGAGHRAGCCGSAQQSDADHAGQEPKPRQAVGGPADLGDVFVDEASHLSVTREVLTC